MGELLERIVTWALEVIATVGYPGIAFLIALEQVFPPIPSELILPLSGSLSASGRFNFAAALAAATVGSLTGASVLYGIGRWGGARRIGDWLDRYGKWMLLSRDDLDKSRVWFARYGSLTVLIARFIPGMRTFVSVPAGLALMPYWRFLLFTAIGSGLWNAGLIGAGYYLGKNWEQVKDWLAPFGPLIYVIMVLVLGLFVGRRLWARFGPPARKGAQE